MSRAKRFQTHLIFLVALCSSAIPSFAIADANTQLLEAVTEGSIADMQKAIDAGADLNWFGGRRFNSKPLCMATRVGHEDMLEALIVAGADPGIMYFPKTDVYSSDPMACAAHNRNLKAFKILHDHGVALDRNYCQDCNATGGNTVLFAALGPERWNIARYVIEHSTPSEGQIRAIVAVVEKRAVFDNDTTLDDREWITEWLREGGHEVTPREVYAANK